MRSRGLTLPVPASPRRRHLVKVDVRLHDDPDGRPALCRGPRRLARHDRAGRLEEEQPDRLAT